MMRAWNILPPQTDNDAHRQRHERRYEYNLNLLAKALKTLCVWWIYSLSWHTCVTESQDAVIDGELSNYMCTYWQFNVRRVLESYVQFLETMEMTPPAKRLTYVCRRSRQDHVSSLTGGTVTFWCSTLMIHQATDWSEADPNFSTSRPLETQALTQSSWTGRTIRVQIWEAREVSTSFFYSRPLKMVNLESVQ